MKILINQLAAVVALTLSTGTWAQTQADPKTEGSGPNKNIVRWAEGTYLYKTVSEKKERGWERFYMNVHPDGTRTIMMWHDLYARNAQFTVTLRVAENFRPLESYLSYWTQSGFKGTAITRVLGDKLYTTTSGPLGEITQNIAVPEKISIGTHPVAADGWHTWYESTEGSTLEKGGVLYSMESGDDSSKPPLGRILPFSFERLGKEKITVPAGTFDAIKYKLGGNSEAWILEQDRLMVRVLNAPRDLEYVLTTFKAGAGSKQ